ncbi:prealbumin-like fold domain-containing protein [Enterococcus faecalis]|uniref:prealbumin-like fold domain-containing protein n=1 Tax=Enterococcus faecalis TaxID=1351 RepID=UPI0013D36E97|nr:SpaA isopeptide-forming pilin-related protein [Enterococcus faecalis]NGG35353.1 hypothetical protein [Enterococcus faecalis]
MVAGTDYSLTWNSPYTDLIATTNNASTRIAGNGKRVAYRMLYSTTAPANGTKIANYVEMATVGQELTNTTEVTTKRIIVERESKVYSAEEVSKGKFTIVETKAPIGYILDSTPMEVSVGEEGIVCTINNTKEKIAIPKKKLHKYQAIQG